MANVTYTDEPVLLGRTLCYLRTKYVRSNNRVIYTIRTHRRGKGVKLFRSWCFRGNEIEALRRLEKNSGRTLKFVLYVPLSRAIDGTLVSVPELPNGDNHE